MTKKSERIIDEIRSTKDLKELEYIKKVVKETIAWEKTTTYEEELDIIFS